MGGSTYSRRKQRVQPSERNPEFTLAGKYFRGVVEDNKQWHQEELKHLYDIKRIPIDKLYATKNKMSTATINSETEKHSRMEDYEPINVIKQDKRYIVISGHERVVALMVRGFKRIKARVYDMNRKK